MVMNMVPAGRRLVGRPWKRWIAGVEDLQKMQVWEKLQQLAEGKEG